MLRQTSAFLLFSLAFCSSASAEPLSTAIVGAWRWVKVNDRPVDKPFYFRYNADGSCCSWPVPKEWPNVRGVSYGKYAVAKGVLILDTGSGKFDPKAKLLIKGNEMTVTTEDSDRMIYRRIVPTLDPGKYEPHKP